MTLHHTMWVAAGGAIGAIGRHAAVTFFGAVLGTGFPYGTLFVNVAGGFILGAFIEVSAVAWSPSPELRSMIIIGILGAFTTFSTFSLDVINLYTHGKVATAAFYTAASVGFSVLAVWAGIMLTRLVVH